MSACWRPSAASMAAPRPCRAIEAALAAFGNVNVDLMYGLPAQTPEMARADLEQALGFGVPHVSAYQLTIEPNTVFWNRPPQLPEHDTRGGHAARHRGDAGIGGLRAL